MIKKCTYTHKCIYLFTNLIQNYLLAIKHMKSIKITKNKTEKLKYNNILKLVMTSVASNIYYLNFL